MARQELNKPYHRLSMAQPLKYRIEVQGQIDENWSEWFEGMEITLETGVSPVAITMLTGTITDQAALQGLIRKLYNLGYILRRITCLDAY